MFNLINGHFIWASFAICAVGLIYKTVTFLKVTEKKSYPKNTQAPKAKEIEHSKFYFKAKLKSSLLSKKPVMILMSSIFHISFFAALLFVTAHNIYLDLFFNISLPSLPENITNFFTLIVLFCGLFFLLRRIFFKRVRAISTLDDYIILLISIAPFLTGFLAFNQLIN